MTKLTSTVNELQLKIEVLLSQPKVINSEHNIIENVTPSPPSCQTSPNNIHNIKVQENLNLVVKKQIKDAVIVTPSHSIITAEESMTPKDKFKISKQASDRSWDNRSIMAGKSTIIIQQNDPN